MSTALLEVERIHTAEGPNTLPKVLHILEATLGGTLRYLRDILASVDAERYTSGLIYSRERADASFDEALARARSLGWETFEVPMLRAISPAQDMRCARQIRGILQRFQPSIVHCHSSKAGALGRLACVGLSRRPKVVYNPHAVAANMGPQYLMVEKILRPLADRLGAVSAGERDELVRLRLSKDEKIEVIHPLIDTEFYTRQSRSEARAVLGVPADCKLIVGIGRLVEQKNPLMFVEVVRLLAERDATVRAVWLGEGELQDSMVAEVKRLGLQSVLLLPGWQADVRPYLAAANLLLSTAAYESFGYVAAEALAMEIPVVASAISGTTDIMAGYLEDLLYEPGDAAMAGRIIRRLFEDETYAQAMGEFGRARVVEQFSPRKMSAALTRCYEELLNEDAGITT